MMKKIDRVILLVPHADDELINLNLQELQNSKNHCILVTYTNEERMFKFKRVMEYYSTSYSEPVFNDGFLLSYDRKYVYNVLKSRVVDYKPDMIVSPSIFDTHPEHLLVAAIATRIALELKIPIHYSTSQQTEETSSFIDGSPAYTFYKKEITDLVNNGYMINSLSYGSHTTLGEDL